MHSATWQARSKYCAKHYQRLMRGVKLEGGPIRYNQLLPIIDHVKPRTIVEVGTWNGLRAIQMAAAALQYGPVEYYGYDLFEDATEETDERELNVKAHHSAHDVGTRLAQFAENNPDFKFLLVKGDTKETLKNAPEKVDLAFIDGGHSLETIQSDYEALKHAGCVVFDDYYTDGPDIERFGCNKLIDTLKDRVILPQTDPVKGGGGVQMVVAPSSAWPGKKSLIVKTKNCVSDNNIQANIRYASSLVRGWVDVCEPHSGVGVIVAGGASWKKQVKKIKKFQDEGAYVFCVKSTHNELIKKGVIPWGCLLLDPRPHVAAIIEPHEGVRYFVATMCHPTTVDKILESKHYAYHAHVGAGEMDVVKQMLGDGFLVGGGSTAACRGMTLLHTLGFRTIHLFGFDSCYPTKESQYHGIKPKELFQVTVSGRDFWTDAELLAQGQDFDKLLEQRGLAIEVHGDGMFKHILEVRRKATADFEALYG